MRCNLLILAAVAVFLGAGGAAPFGLQIPRTALASPGDALSAGSRPDAGASRPVAILDTIAAERTPAPRSRRSAAEVALDALEKHVREQSHPDALRLALDAYYGYRTANPERVRKPYLYFVDYGLDNHTPRGYVFDMEALRLVEGPFTVAHGRGSSRQRNGVPTRFTNIKDSATSSLGLYLTQETYAFRGTSGGRRYRSIGLRLKGLSGRFNSAARARGIVVHGAPYVTPSQAGRSEGCPAMEESRAQRLIPMISGGSLVFLFSPLDETWMEQDPWLRAGARMASASR